MNDGKRLKEIREECLDEFYSQEKLAKLLGCSQSKIRDIENGRVKNIPADLARKLRDKKGINIEYTLFGELPVYEKDKQLKNINALMSKYKLTMQEANFIISLLEDKTRLKSLIAFIGIMKD